MKQLRDYQREAIDSLYDYWTTHPKPGNPLIVAPCGAGKSLIIASFIKEAMEYPDTRILCLTHRKELLEQNALELYDLWPNADIGFYSAGMNKKERHTSILFAGIQSIWNKITTFDPFDLVIIDEAHLIPRTASTRYGEAIKYLKMTNPLVKFVGLTATPYRLDSGLLHEGDGSLFDNIVYEIPLRKLIDEGHLCEVVGKRGAQVADLSAVHKRGGEYIQGEMEKAMDVPALTKAACKEIVAYGENRKAWIIFSSGLKHSDHIKEALKIYGVNAEIVSGKTPKQEREQTIESFKNGSLKCIINVDVLTIGFNAPICDLGVLLRATASTALYVQITGRLMRTYPGKENALLLDYGGNVERHGPIDMVKPKKPSDGKGDAPAKVCPECNSIVHASSLECQDCGYLFPERTPSHERSAYSGAIMSHQVEGQWIEVSGINYYIHKKMGKPDSVRIEFNCGMRIFKHWWMPEHKGYARTKTIKELIKVGIKCPDTSKELLEMSSDIPAPYRIYVKPDGKYERVEQIDYSSQDQTTARKAAMG